MMYDVWVKKTVYYSACIPVSAKSAEHAKRLVQAEIDYNGEDVADFVSPYFDEQEVTDVVFASMGEPNEL